MEEEGQERRTRLEAEWAAKCGDAEAMVARRLREQFQDDLRLLRQQWENECLKQQAVAQTIWEDEKQHLQETWDEALLREREAARNAAQQREIEFEQRLHDEKEKDDLRQRCEEEQRKLQEFLQEEFHSEHEATKTAAVERETQLRQQWDRDRQQLQDRWKEQREVELEHLQQETDSKRRHLQEEMEADIEMERFGAQLEVAEERRKWEQRWTSERHLIQEKCAEEEASKIQRRLGALKQDCEQHSNELNGRLHIELQQRDLELEHVKSWLTTQEAAYSNAQEQVKQLQREVDEVQRLLESERAGRARAARRQQELARAFASCRREGVKLQKELEKESRNSNIIEALQKELQHMSTGIIEGKMRRRQQSGQDSERLQRQELRSEHLLQEAGRVAQERDAARLELQAATRAWRGRLDVSLEQHDAVVQRLQEQWRELLHSALRAHADKDTAHLELRDAMELFRDELEATSLSFKRSLEGEEAALAALSDNTVDLRAMQTLLLQSHNEADLLRGKLWENEQAESRKYQELEKDTLSLLATMRDFDQNREDDVPDELVNARSVIIDCVSDSDLLDF